MKSNKWIYSFFISLALLFWNPISYYLFYGNTELFSRGQNNILYLIYTFIFLGGVTIIFLIQKDKLGEIFKNISLSIAYIGILFSVLVIGNSIVGLFSKNRSEQDNNQGQLLFEPNSSAKYETVEFEFEANINSLGLRDGEINIDKGNNYRILCFGDSWTYGWGVNIEDSWPKKLEEYLSINGYGNIEVINCGQPGHYTSTQKKYLKSIVPLLNPDLVLVGVLQLDDLAQIYSNKFTRNQIFNKAEIIKTYTEKFKTIFISYLKYSFNNILSSSQTVEVTSYWKKKNNSMIDDFHHWQNIRFYTLDDTVQSLIKSGNLKPGLLDYYINFPDRVTIFNNPNHPATKYSISEMTKDFEEMKTICYKQNSDIVFVNIPMNYFTGHEVIRSPNDALNPYYEKNNNIDQIYRSVASANDLPYIELTNHFINLKNKSDYLFKYDGHPNKNGYEEIANYIGKQIIEKGYLKIIK